MLVGIRAAVLLLLLLLAQYASGQVTSIFLSYHGQQTEQARVLVFDLVTPYHEGVQTIDYRVVGATAEAGKDFVGSSGTFVFQPNEVFKQFTIQLLDDSEFEGAEHFYIELSNAVPEQPYRAINYVTIIDDDRGYSPAHNLYRAENIGYFTIPIYRWGDIEFASWVEVYLEEGTAKAGVDYEDRTFTVQFGPKDSMKMIRVPLINNTVEDAKTSEYLARGDRYFYVKLRNGTGGIPIAEPGRGEMIIQDNELGYALRGASGATDLVLYEGGPEPLVLERLGDYDVSSIAKVKFRPADLHYLFPSAEPEADYAGTEFDVQFAPGQTAAEVPLVIVNDTLAEPREWLNVQYPTNLTTLGTLERSLSIIDNEFNPLPVTTFCLAFPELSVSIVPLRPTSVTPLRDGKFLVAVGDDFDSKFMIGRFNESGEPDPAFNRITLQVAPGKIVEGADGKYTMSFSNWRTGQEWIERYLADGRLDPTFQQSMEPSPTTLQEFEVTRDGKVYVGSPLCRLNADGTLDQSFAPPDLGHRGEIIVDAAENVYVNGVNGWIRLKPSGEIDSSFSEFPADDMLREIGGVLYGRRFDSWEMVETTRRIMPSGASDPSFTPITNAWVYGGMEGKLYGIQQVGSETHVQRYHEDGTVDRSYMRGTLDITGDTFGYRMIANGRGFMTHLGFGSINGASMECRSGFAAVARVDLEVSPQRTIIEPGKSQFLERAAVGEQSIPILRTGDNTAGGTIHYRIRSDTALPGEHFVAADEGELAFEPNASRILMPITIRDNGKPEADRTFFMDLLNKAGVVESTFEFIIQNDDLGLEVVEREGNTLRLRAIAGEFDGVWIMRTSDFRKWEVDPVEFRYDGEIFDIEMNEANSFIRAQGYSQ